MTHITIAKPGDFHLADHDPSLRPPIKRAEGEERLAKASERIAECQNLMMANQTWSLLAVFQGMDGSGKDGTIDHVLHAVNPAGLTVNSFKMPSDEEHRHDFLWHAHSKTPPAGTIGVFNRSYYEEVLVPRVHADDLAQEHLPDSLLGRHLWPRRLADIVDFERLLANNGTLVHKFFLHISKDEQRQRLLARLDDPAKQWKFSPSDLSERGFWGQYQIAYSEAISATATPNAPWHIIPADHKWYARMLVAEIIAASLEALDLQLPALSTQLAAAVKAARSRLSHEKSSE